jgi:hypothetical protein
VSFTLYLIWGKCWRFRRAKELFEEDIGVGTNLIECTFSLSLGNSVEVEAEVLEGGL